MRSSWQALPCWRAFARAMASPLLRCIRLSLRFALHAVRSLSSAPVDGVQPCSEVNDACIDPQRGHGAVATACLYVHVFAVAEGRQPQCIPTTLDGSPLSITSSGEPARHQPRQLFVRGHKPSGAEERSRPIPKLASRSTSHNNIARSVGTKSVGDGHHWLLKQRVHSLAPKLFSYTQSSRHVRKHSCTNCIKTTRKPKKTRKKRTGIKGKWLLLTLLSAKFCPQ